MQIYRLRPLLALMLLLLVPRWSFAEDGVEVQEAPVASAKPKAAGAVHGLFWEAHGKTGTVYLLGSVHMADKSLYPLPAHIEKAFADSSALGVEVNINGNMTEMQQKLMQAGVYPEGGSLKASLSPETYKKANSVMAPLGLSLDRLDKLKPWMVAMTLGAQKAGLDQSLGIDVHFLNQAQDTDKKIVELEGIDSQIGLFNGFSSMEQEALLFASANEFPKFKSGIQKIMAAWRDGDAERLNKIIHEDDNAYPKLKPFLKALLDDRNIVMATKVASYFESGKTTFVVVGAAHLVGPTGVVALLQAKGFKVTQK
jgi:uncharacterized protein YbaP (TraB family)